MQDNYAIKTCYFTTIMSNFIIISQEKGFANFFELFSINVRRHTAEFYFFALVIKSVSGHDIANFFFLSIYLLIFFFGFSFL